MLETLKSKWQVIAGSIVICITIFTAGYSVSSHDAKFIEKPAFAAHVEENKDIANKVTFQDKKLAVIEQKLDDAISKEDTIIRILQGVNDKSLSPYKTTPYPGLPK